MIAPETPITPKMNSWSNYSNNSNNPGGVGVGVGVGAVPKKRKNRKTKKPVNDQNQTKRPDTELNLRTLEIIMHDGRYPIDLEQDNTTAKVLDTIFQVAEKGWAHS